MPDEMPNEIEMDAFKRGMDAHGRGSPIDANPYQPPSYDPRYDFWMLGWHSANNPVPERKNEQPKTPVDSRPTR